MGSEMSSSPVLLFCDCDLDELPVVNVVGMDMTEGKLCSPARWRSQSNDKIGLVVEGHF